MQSSIPALGQHTIKISVFDGGHFSYSHAVLRAHQKHLIRWFCQHPFTVSFKKTPFEKIGFQATHDLTLDGTDGFTTEYQVVRDDALGVYHYAVAVAEQNVSGTKVWINAGCPEVDVG